MKPISYEQINSLLTPKQHFKDCYLVSSLSALAKIESGRKILRNNILSDGDTFCVKFNNVNGKSERYIVKQKECDELILTDKYLEIIPITVPHTPIVKVVEVAMNKLLRLHPNKKPSLSKMLACNEDFEYNSPSDFLKMFTGIKPISLNEHTFKNSMKSKKEQVQSILKAISTDDNSTFIAGTGFDFTFALANWHCYNIEKADKFHNLVTLRDNRHRCNFKMSFEDVCSRFKFICGYFNESLRYANDV